jgi:hypothetical protein
MKIGNRVEHKIYGLGTIVESCLGKKGSLNIAVKFDKGGPMGFAEYASNDVKSLTVVK